MKARPQSESVFWLFTTLPGAVTLLVCVYGDPGNLRTETESCLCRVCCSLVTPAHLARGDVSCDGPDPGTA